MAKKEQNKYPFVEKRDSGDVYLWLNGSHCIVDTGDTLRFTRDSYGMTDFTNFTKDLFTDDVIEWILTRISLRKKTIHKEYWEHKEG